MKRVSTHPLRIGAILAALALTLAACGGSDDSGGAGKGETIKIGAVPGWTDQTGTAYIYKNILEKHGYKVEIVELSDNAPVFAGVAGGEIDVFGSAWPEHTHKSYMDEYGDQLEDVGTYYEDARLYMAVPEYSDIESISDLPEHADELDGKVIGIEAGSGLMEQTKNEVFPTYDLDGDFELVQASTTAMLTELRQAVDAEKPIVVTLWKPFWANQEFPVRVLEDPEGAYGEPEALHTLAREGFKEDFPEVAEMMATFELTDEQFGEMESTIVNDFATGEDEKAVNSWLEENPDFTPPLEEYLEE